MQPDDLEVSKNRGAPKSFHFNRVFPLFSPSILGYPYFWKHPFGSLFIDREASEEDALVKRGLKMSGAPETMKKLLVWLGWPKKIETMR